MHFGMIRNIYPEGLEHSCSESNSDEESLSELDNSSNSDDPLKEDSDDHKAKRNNGLSLPNVVIK